MNQINHEESKNLGPEILGSILKTLGHKTGINITIIFFRELLYSTKF